MNEDKADLDKAWAVVRDAIRQVAPDVESDDIVAGARLRQDLELDSLDFLRVIETIAHDTGVDVPESAYPEVATVDGLVRFVVAHS